MCGLFGILGNGIIREDIGVFKDLMVFSALRGQDSTGFAAGNSRSNSEVKVVKAATDPLYFLQFMDDKDKDFLDKTSNNFFMGHTRARTRGETGVKGAQPFDVGGMIGTHNGTIDGEFEGFNSDSEKFISNISYLGIRGATKRLLSSDAYATVVYNKKTKDIVISRNSARPLFYALHPQRHVLYYASEAGMLYAACWRNRVFPEDTFSFHPDIAYFINPAEIIRKNKFTYRFADLKPQPVVPPTPPKTQETNQNEQPVGDV